MYVRVRVCTLPEDSNAAISDKIISSIESKGGIVEALKDFKPASNIVGWGREMSKLGYCNKIKYLSGSQAVAVREYADAHKLPVGQVFTYLYLQGEQPTALTTTMIQGSLIDSGTILSRVEYKLKEINDLVGQLRSVTR